MAKRNSWYCTTNKYLEKYSAELTEMIKRKKDAFYKCLSEWQDSNNMKTKREARHRTGEEQILGENMQRYCQHDSWKKIWNIRSNKSGNNILQIIAANWYIKHYTIVLHKKAWIQSWRHCGNNDCENRNYRIKYKQSIQKQGKTWIKKYKN